MQLTPAGSEQLRAQIQADSNYHTHDLSKLAKRLFLCDDLLKKITSTAHDHPDQTAQALKETLSKRVRFKPWSTPLARNIFLLPESLIIKKVCQDLLFSDQMQIIEIGAGTLESGLSHLMQRLPEELLPAVQPTDSSQHLVDHCPSKKLKLVNTLQFNESYAANSIDQVLASSVLDVIPDTDLLPSLQKIHKALKPGGHLVHFANLNRYANTLLSHYSLDQNSVIFPWVDRKGFHRGVQVIEKHRLENFSHTEKKVDLFARAFLSWYSGLPAIRRELLMENMLEDLKEDSETFHLSNWIERLNPPGLIPVDNYTFSDLRIKEALNKAGFEILTFHHEWQQVAISAAGNEDLCQKTNYFELNDGKYIDGKYYVIAPKKIVISVKMQVIVARKKKL